MPLSLDIDTKEEEAAKARESIARREKELAEGFEKSGSPISPTELEKLTRKYLAKDQALLKLIEEDFLSLRTDRITSAARHLMTASAPRHVIEAMVKALPEDLTRPLTDLLKQMQVIKDRPKLYPMPKPADNQFKDFGFKVMVIDELMYVQKRMQPLFDVRRFADEWTKREISIEDDGYEIIPEVRTYFKNIAIPAELLNEVEVLTQKPGIDGVVGGAIDQLYPFWDPGSGDGPIPVTDKAIADLDLLPNLKRVAGL